MFDLGEHQRQIQENLGYWNAKPVLRDVYREFHELIARNLCNLDGETIELGSGIGNIKEVVPHCVRTDLFPNPWIDRQEDAYALSMQNGAVSNLILFDVFHHLEFPMNAMTEFHRALVSGGRLIVFDHAMSVFGWIFSRFVHHEKAGFSKPFNLGLAEIEEMQGAGYYADHANAYRFFQKNFNKLLGEKWRVVSTVNLSAFKWILSGGYRGPSMVFNWNKALINRLECLLDKFPQVTATRVLIVLEKPVIQ
jgi:hypothetical protein